MTSSSCPWAAPVGGGRRRWGTLGRHWLRCTAACRKPPGGGTIQHRRRRCRHVPGPTCQRSPAWHRSNLSPHDAAMCKTHGCPAPPSPLAATTTPPHQQPPAAKHLPVDHQAAMRHVIFELSTDRRMGKRRRMAPCVHLDGSGSFFDHTSCISASSQYPATRRPPSTPRQPCPSLVRAPLTRSGSVGVPSRSTRNSSVSMKAIKVWCRAQRRRQRSYSATWGPCVPGLGRAAGRVGEGLAFMRDAALLVHVRADQALSREATLVNADCCCIAEHTRHNAPAEGPACDNP